MRSRDCQRVVADQIARRTEDLSLSLGISRNLSIILRIAGVAKEDDTGNLVLRRRGKTLDRIVHNRAALAISSDENCRVRAHGIGHVDDFSSGSNRGIVCVLIQKVGRKSRWVAILGTHALAGDLVSTELLFQTGAGWWTWNLTLGANEVSWAIRVNIVAEVFNLPCCLAR